MERGDKPQPVRSKAAEQRPEGLEWAILELTKQQPAEVQLFVLKRMLRVHMLREVIQAMKVFAAPVLAIGALISKRLFF